MNIELLLTKAFEDTVHALYSTNAPLPALQIQETRREFEGDFTFVVFPLLKLSGKGPEQTATELGEKMVESYGYISGYNVVKGFLNLSLDYNHWLNFLETYPERPELFPVTQPKSYMIEYSSPNTNKPLHLGHVRNNLLGVSMANILKANGHNVFKVNLVNDRGIHICKSMLAWKRWGNGETPESSGKKGDHLVGDYYVKFDVEYKKEITELKKSGISEEEAARKAPVILEAQEMLRKWEARDSEIIELWTMMNDWVYQGFDETYKRLGVDFDKVYYESNTYLLGKKIVLEGLEKGILFRKDDGSVWADLTSDGLDQKLLLRSDGTSVYMTQDVGTACQRFSEYNIDEHIYVVGNEQNYHFQVLSLILGKLGYEWAGNIHHMSYGMVELPDGKMKSREGTVVDADDLMDDMNETAMTMSKELGKLDGIPAEKQADIVRRIGMAALKYFILKVDPRKNMTFDPKESIDFNGNTGPFIQYTYARILSVLRKAEALGITLEKPDPAVKFDDKERMLLRMIYRYSSVVKSAGETLNPSLIANFVYDMAKEFNQFYHDHRIVQEENPALRNFRLNLSLKIAGVIKSSMNLLGIELPDRM